MTRIHTMLSSLFEPIYHLPLRRDHGYNLSTEVAQSSPTSSDEFDGIRVPLSSEQTFDIPRPKRDRLLL